MASTSGSQSAAHRAHVSRSALIEAHAGDARVVLRLPPLCVE